VSRRRLWAARSPHRRLAAAAIAAALAAGVGLAGCESPANVGAPGPDGYVTNHVPVGLSLPDGPMADGVRLAIKEINETGGVLGLPLRLLDGTGTRAVVAFGCPAGGTTAAAMYYCPGDGGPSTAPGGGEPRAFYTGSAPNQRVVPALEYLVSQGRTSLYLAVDDDPLSRATAAIVRAYAATGAVTVIGQSSIADLSRAATTRPRATAVLSTLSAAKTARFLDAYGRAGLRPDRVPVLSVSLTEADLPAVPGLAGQLMGGSYFQSLPGRANEAFVTAFRREVATTGPATGPATAQPAGEPVESAYLAVYVWRAMVAKAGSFRPEEVLARDGLVIDAPEGRVMVDAPRGHLYRTARVGRVGADGVVRTVWESGALVRPDPELLAYPWARADAGVR